MSAIGYRQSVIGFYSDFIPQTCFNERLMCQSATLHYQRLYLLLIEVVHQLGQRTVMSQDYPSGIGTVPVAYIQLGVVAIKSGMSHEDGIFFSP